MTRDTEIQTFLDKNGWGTARRAKLAGDASSRSYDRLQKPSGDKAVLMNAPPYSGEDITSFLKRTFFDDYW